MGGAAGITAGQVAATVAAVAPGASRLGRIAAALSALLVSGQAATAGATASAPSLLESWSCCPSAGTPCV